MTQPRSNNAEQIRLENNRQRKMAARMLVSRLFEEHLEKKGFTGSVHIEIHGKEGFVGQHFKVTTAEIVLE